MNPLDMLEMDDGSDLNTPRYTAPVSEVYHDPAGFGFPPSLPIEIALHERPIKEICKVYGLSKEAYERICQQPAFLKAVEAAVESVRQEGFTFKVKARMQAEELLKKSWQMIHDTATPRAVQADLIKQTVKWAGYEPKNEPIQASGAGFSLTINLSGTPTPQKRAIEGEKVDVMAGIPVFRGAKTPESDDFLDID